MGGYESFEYLEAVSPDQEKVALLYPLVELITVVEQDIFVVQAGIGRKFVRLPVDLEQVSRSEAPVQSSIVLNVVDRPTNTGIYNGGFPPLPVVDLTAARKGQTQEHGPFGIRSGPTDPTGGSQTVATQFA